LKLTLSTFLCSDSTLIFPFPSNSVVLYIYFPFFLTSLVSFHNPISSVFHLGPPQHTFTPIGSLQTTIADTHAQALCWFILFGRQQSPQKSKEFHRQKCLDLGDVTKIFTELGLWSKSISVLLFFFLFFQSLFPFTQ